MGYFDLNILYETSQTKASRTKLVIKAMELGYTGIAYNRTMKGVMSDHDRCSIPLLSLSSLLAVAPSLSASVNLHRDLLGVPRSSPFRQYTRLTVCVDSPAHSQALNSGNPILKTYDLVAVRPLNQISFDHACQKSEVDIISIDFSEKLHFRLKQASIKSAIQRGVYFEIMYSDLISDLQARRHIILNTKLLVDWTRGKNLIISSAAPSANELRGPCDVANIAHLLGLSTERAKAAVSRNCRNLLTDSLRRKHFFKEAIKVESIPSKNSSSSETFSTDWFTWDPIASGEGDLQLDDIAKSFSAMAKAPKAIDFTSFVDGKHLVGETLRDATKAIQEPIPMVEMSVKDIHPKEQPFQLQGPSSRDLERPFNSMKNATDSDGAIVPVVMTEEKLRNTVGLDAVFPCDATDWQNVQSQNLSSNSNKSEMSEASAMDVELNFFCVPATDANLGNSTERNAPCTEKFTCSPITNVALPTQNLTVVEETTEIQRAPFVAETSTSEPPGVTGVDKTAQADHVSTPSTVDTMVEDAGSNVGVSEVVKYEEKHNENSNAECSLVQNAGAKIVEESSPHSVMALEAGAAEPTDVGFKKSSNNLNHSPLLSGKPRAKYRTSQVTFPLKRLLRPPFKKKSRKSKHGSGK